MYAAILFAPDGDYVTDYHGCETIAEVQERLVDQGSRWYFYPFHAVIRSHTITRPTNRIVDCAEPFDFAGRTIRTMSRAIAEIPDSDLEAILC